MYTLRTFKTGEQINNYALGSWYSVERAKENEENIKSTVSSPNIPNGFEVKNDQHAFIMTENGKTFETLNRPNNSKKK